MTVVFPDAINAEGNVKVRWVPVLANPASPSLATEINGASAKELTGVILGGAFQPTSEQAKGDDRRLGSKQTFQVFGRITDGVEDVTYVYDPQAAAGAAINIAYEALTQGATGYFVVRYGIDVNTAFAAAQKVDTIPVTCGVQRKSTPPADDEFAKLTVVQGFIVRSTVNRNVAIAA